MFAPDPHHPAAPSVVNTAPDHLAGTTARSFTAIYVLGATDSYIDGNAQYQRARLMPEPVPTAAR